VDAARAAIKDTPYSDTPDVSVVRARRAILEYARAAGWRVREVTREEVGCLPIPLGGTLAEWVATAGPAAPGVLRAGVGAGLFHATTGYSLPFAVRFAEEIGGRLLAGDGGVAATAEQMATREWERGRYLRFLNRMLFRAANPAHRYRVFEKFYRFDEPLIARFYAARLTPMDQVRILTGRPPVPVIAALPQLWE
jgi:lycopene beta-cyclase